MNTAKPTFWLFFILMALGGVGLYVSSSLTIKPLGEVNLSQSTDAFILHLEVQRFDENGHLVHHLETPEMQHIPAENTYFLKTPHIQIIQPGEPAWDIRSNQATAIHGGEHITFKDQVILHQNTGGHTQESTIKTEQLTYFQQEKLAISDQAVQFIQPGIIINSIGIRASLTNKRIQLLSKARALYEPKHA